MESVAVIGTGIAGMAAAARLHRAARLTLYEQNPSVGGHTNTVEIKRRRGTLPVDTGFMVYNEVTYPRLTRLFAELGVATTATEMSFGVHHVDSGFLWSSRVARDWRHHWPALRQPRFWRMLTEILRFNRLARRALERGEAVGSLAGFLQLHRFGPTFIDSYLVPMTGAIWSTPPDEMMRFPAEALLRFLSNHGLLGLRTHHQWRTVVGGSRQYRDKLIAPFRDRIYTARPVRTIERHEDGVWVVDGNGERRRFDRAVVATHADQALALLSQPTPLEKRLLGAFRYSASEVQLHRDERVLPSHRSLWAAWNYRLEDLPGEPRRASTHYWMNRLQHLPGPDQHIVSLNAAPGLIDPAKVDWSTTYEHPTFDEASLAAQPHLATLNSGRLFFAGSYFRHGFHEDALMAGEEAAAALLAEPSSDAEPSLIAV